jgi:hypothetical protein
MRYSNHLLINQLIIERLNQCIRNRYSPCISINCIRLGILHRGANDRHALILYRRKIALAN